MKLGTARALYPSHASFRRVPPALLSSQCRSHSTVLNAHQPAQKRESRQVAGPAARHACSRSRRAKGTCCAADPGGPRDATPAPEASHTQASHSGPAVPQQPDQAQGGGSELPVDAWEVTKSMLQLWVILLGLGYAGVPQVAQLLSGLHNSGSKGLDQAAALFLVEGSVLLAVRALLQRKAVAAEGQYWVPRLVYRWDARSAGVGLAAGAAALALNNTLMSLLGQAASQPENTGGVASILQSHDGLAAVLLFAGSALLAPAAEEAVYRGFLLPSLQRTLPAPAAVAIVAVLFAAAHLEADGLVQLTILGSCLGAAAVVSDGNLVAPTLGHILYNSALFVSLIIEGQ